jgi:hypothetical protein
LEPIIKPSDLGFLKIKSIWQIWVTLKKNWRILCVAKISCQNLAKVQLLGLPFFLDKFPNIWFPLVQMYIIQAHTFKQKIKGTNYVGISWVHILWCILDTCCPTLLFELKFDS